MESNPGPPVLQAHSPPINFAFWQVGGLANIDKLLFDTYVNNKLLNGIPSVVAFYYQLATLFTFPSSFPCPLLSYVCICYVEKLEATSLFKHAAYLCGHKMYHKRITI